MALKVTPHGAASQVAVLRPGAQVDRAMHALSKQR
jgi:hypothetical protein